jgi:hypothetical protein
MIFAKLFFQKKFLYEIYYSDSHGSAQGVGHPLPGQTHENEH